MTAIVQGPGPQNKVEAQSPVLGSKQKISQLQLNVVLSKQVTDKHHRVNPRQIRNWTILIPGQEGKKTDYYDCSKLNLGELCMAIHAKANSRRNGFSIKKCENLGESLEFSLILVTISVTKPVIFYFSQNFRQFGRIFQWQIWWTINIFPFFV